MALFQLQADTALSHANRMIVRRLKNSEPFVKLWAFAVSREARANCRAKPGRQFWKQLANSIKLQQISATSFLIRSDHVGANIKQFGGVIKPKRAKFLTIPLDKSITKGQRAWEFASGGKSKKDLFVIRSGGKLLLGYSKGKGKTSQFMPVFLLAKSSTQKPDPWFPQPHRVNELASQTLKRFNL